MNSSMWSFTSSRNVACSFFFFRQEVIGGGVVAAGEVCFSAGLFCVSILNIIPDTNVKLLRINTKNLV